MSNYRTAFARYRVHRKHTRELLEEEAFHVFKLRVNVVTIDEDILRRVRQEWAGHLERKVDWDWEKGIVDRMWRKNARGLDLGFVVEGQLCGLAAARMSDAKRWLSLTHIEGAPMEHPLKGRVLPLVINGLYIYRALANTEETLKSTGIRVLNPLDEALPCYEKQGYTLSTSSKRLRSIVIEPIDL